VSHVRMVEFETKEVATSTNPHQSFFRQANDDRPDHAQRAAVNFTNIVHSPPSAPPRQADARPPSIGRLIAAVWRHLFSPRKAKKEPTLLEFARRYKH
jgi:hypothetical protein